jgi:acetyltransferase-like isoleucine patch superfamily enzyme
MEPFLSNALLVSGLHVPMSDVGELNSVERAGTIELTQAAVQVEPKRKRPLTKRTKTGCGTCRRRKKKCDEAKPECDNCKRNGLVCQGYANKVPLPRNGVLKSLPSLQDHTRMSIDARQLHNRPQGYDLAHIVNCEPSLGSSQSIRQDLHASVQSADACDRAIAVEEHGCQLPASSGETGKYDLSRILYPREQPSPPAPYPRPPLAPAPVHERDASHERLRVTQRIQNLPALCYNPCVHDQTPQSVSHVTADSSAVASEAHEQRKQSSWYPSLAIPIAAPRPPLSWHKAARGLPKTEKQKMLDGEPFTPYNTQLIDERRQCATMVYRFNNTVDGVTEVVQSIRERCFRAVVDAAWAQPRYGDRPVGGHLGNNAHVATPFHCDYGYNVFVGDNVVIGPNSQLLDSARITIGENTRIGACVTIMTLEAPTDMKSLKGGYGTEVAKEVYIGKNVYIGDCCVVEAGVRVGNGAIVRSGSVVIHDIPPDYIARGNPANMYKAN